MIFAGTDTTSSGLARTFDLLSQHPDVQDKLREEVKGWENWSYDEIIAHPYLDAVCRETLRLYAPAQIVPRVFVHHSSHLISRPNSRTNFQRQRRHCCAAQQAHHWCRR